MSDGTLTGTDGCDTFTGQWTQDADGQITLTKTSTSDNTCDGIDTWLSKAVSAEIHENYLYGRNSSGEIIGGLQ